MHNNYSTISAIMSDAARSRRKRKAPHVQADAKNGGAKGGEEVPEQHGRGAKSFLHFKSLLSSKDLASVE